MAEASPTTSVDGISRNTLFALAYQLTMTVFTVVVTMYLLRALGPQGFGVFSLGLGIAALARLVASFGIPASAARYIAEERADPIACAEILRASQRLTLATSTVVALGLWVLSAPLARAFGEPDLAWVLRGMAVLSVPEALVLLHMTTFAGLARVRLSFRVVLLEGIAETAATVLLVTAGAGAAGAAFGRATGYAVGALVGIVIIVRLYGRAGVALRRHTRPGLSREIARYAVPTFLTGSLYGVYSIIDVLIISALLSSTATGLFSAPMRLTAALGQLGNAVATSVSPMQAKTERPEAQRVDVFVASVRWLLVLQCILLAPVIVWAEPIVTLLFGEDYDESVNVLRLLSPYLLLTSIGPLVATTATFIGKAGSRVPITAAALGINIAVDVALLPVIGVSAAAIGTSLAFAVYVPAHLIVCRRSLGFSMRPIVLTLARSLLAAAAMALVLYAIGGTSGLSIVEAATGGATGTLAYLCVLVLSHEVTRADVDDLRRRVATLRRGRRPSE